MPDNYAVIYGLEGLTLHDRERDFFKEINPFGYILFARNVENPDQLCNLTNSIRSISGNPNTPILIDQEGGRVRRLRPPHWRDFPPARVFGDLWKTSPTDAKHAVRLNSMLLAAELTDVGIDVDCAPLVDIPQPGANDIIGDRAFSEDIDAIIELACIQAETFLAHGVMPIIKHIPGHGRAMADSHLELPIVSATAQTLNDTDFRPFMALNNIPLGMTAHIIYEAFDKDFCATESKIIINEVIRQKIGFDGLLMSDDLSMKALSGTFFEKAQTILSAGCDLLLHCSGNMDEMVEVTKGARPMDEAAIGRWDKALTLRSPMKAFDRKAIAGELEVLLS